MQDINRLWAHANSPGGGLLASYPSLLADMLEEAAVHKSGDLPHLLLPSDSKWQSKMYKQLVEQQRKLNIMPAPVAAAGAVELKPSAWDTCSKGRCSKSAHIPSSNASSDIIPSIWTSQDIAKAARLLGHPPHEARFASEHDMRNVYSLIYDVFRYKNVLQKALEDTRFYYEYPELSKQQEIVWLILFELQARRWKEHSGKDRTECEKIFNECDCCGIPLTSVKNSVWNLRVKLGAAIARLRIAHNALKLSELLPNHLRDERVARCSRLAPVTAWINKNVLEQMLDAVFEFKELGINTADIETQQRNDVLPENKYVWDSLCPMFIRMGCNARATLADSKMVKEHRLIIQERSFCYGPAMICKLLYEMELAGSVVLTHLTSPRTVAYLGTLLAHNDKIFSLICFGAGDRREEYEEYLSRLRVPHVLINRKEFTKADLQSDLFENVVAILATPPNSYSAVLDPVDLVMGMSAGQGEKTANAQLQMLETLTDTEQSEAGKMRVRIMLAEQLDTLRTAMSRPQIQLVLYETHSQMPVENQRMVWQALQDVNMAVKLQIAERKGLLPEQQLPRFMQSKQNIPVFDEINNNLFEAGTSKEEEKLLKVTNPAESEFDDLIEEIEFEIPGTDTWLQCPVPDLCFNADSCVRMREEGCFLALLTRKEITHFDSKQMIKMAEARGLFGAAMSAPKQEMAQTTIVKKRQKGRAKLNARRGSFQVERISAQTHASLARSTPTSSSKPMVPTCPRNKIDRPIGISPARQWWAETTRYLTRLRRSLIRQKLLPPDAVRALIPQDELLESIRNIDEIIKRGGPTQSKIDNVAHIPAFPRLRLSRNKIPPERIPFPIYNCSVELPEKIYYSKQFL